MNRFLLALCFALVLLSGFLGIKLAQSRMFVSKIVLSDGTVETMDSRSYMETQKAYYDGWNDCISENKRGVRP